MDFSLPGHVGWRVWAKAHGSHTIDDGKNDIDNDFLDLEFDAHP